MIFQKITITSQSILLAKKYLFVIHVSKCAWSPCWVLVVFQKNNVYWHICLYLSHWPWWDLMGPDPVWWWYTEWDIHLVIIVAVTEVRRDSRRGSSSFTSSPSLIEAASPSTPKLLIKAGIGEDWLGGRLLAAGPHLDRYSVSVFVLSFVFVFEFVSIFVS